MMIVLLVAGIGLVLAGLVAIGFGIPINEFGFGNTLIVAGTVTACTGMLLLGLWAAVKELGNIARRLAPGAAAEYDAEIPLEPAPALSTPRSQAADKGGFLFSRDRPESEHAGTGEPVARGSEPLPPWREEAPLHDGARDDGPLAPAATEAAPAVKPRRNLLFSSSSRKERERAQGRTIDPFVADSHPEPAAAPPAAEPAEPPPASFDVAWPKLERSRTADVAPPRRAPRNPPASSETPNADHYPPAVRNDDPVQVTVLKSGVVDGMAYSLYSDGSIEAQMPEGMMRFASIDELRAHLDQRP
jgi:hypothetical protein